MAAFVCDFELDEILKPPGWMRDGACIEHPELSWFPAKGESNREARAICERCAVRPECLAYALAENVSEGIWGGLSAQERRKRRAACLPEMVTISG